VLHFGEVLRPIVYAADSVRQAVSGGDGRKEAVVAAGMSMTFASRRESHGVTRLMRCVNWPPFSSASLSSSDSDNAPTRSRIARSNPGRDAELAARLADRRLHGRARDRNA
jgi:hypothetical protein